jgi:thiol-disulfide isomerase/thioredoxin
MEMELNMFFLNTFSRLLWAAVIAGIGMFLWLGFNRWILKRAGKNRPAQGSNGVPSILFFTTPTCASCKTFQRPVLQHVKKILGDCLQVVEIDASMQPELARQWGILSVPTTFILDSQGQPKHVNHGLVSAEKLLKQLERI